MGKIEEKPKRRKRLEDTNVEEEPISAAFIRNNHLQVDLLCLWKSIMSSDAFLGDLLLSRSDGSVEQFSEWTHTDAVI